MAQKPVTALAKRLPVPVEMIERRIYMIRGQKLAHKMERLERQQEEHGLRLAGVYAW